MLSRLAIVNRGELATRVVPAAQELNEEGDHDTTLIALHTEARQHAMFVRAADEPVRLREAASSVSPCLDHAEPERALRVSRADSVWVGWSFVAEDPIAPGESSPRRAETRDPLDRDVRDYPHQHLIIDFTTVGDIWSAETTRSARRRSTSAP